MMETGKRKMPVVLVTIIVVMVIAGVFVALLLTGGGSADKITAAEWNAEYARIYDNPDGVMRFPSYEEGDVIVIAGTITDMDIRHQNETAIVPFAFDYAVLTMDGIQIDGLKWESTVESIITVGDHAEITLHVKNWSISSFTGESISEWDYNNVLPDSTITKV